MKRLIIGLCGLLAVILLLLPSDGQGASLRKEFDDIFENVINLELAGPGSHGQHFTKANVAANGIIIDVLTNYIAVNAATYPLTSSAAAVVYDFSSGAPVAALESTGPIYSQRYETLGKKRLSLGANFTTYDLETIRGMNTDDILVRFLHEDVDDNGTGNLLMEQDFIELQLKTDIDVSIFGFYATYGLSDRLDVGIAIPVVTVNMQVQPTAVMNSSSAVVQGSPLHYWEVDGSPSLVLEGSGMEDGATGIGDVALRAKYNLMDRGDRGLSAYFEWRLATGDEENFLGTGNSSIRALMLGSVTYGDFTPHINLGFDIRSGEFERDEFELSLGYDFMAYRNLTLVANWTGEFELGGVVEDLEFPDATNMVPTSDNSVPFGRSISPTNIPSVKNDNITNIGLGAKWAASQKFVVAASVLFPTNDAGLRGNFVPTIGFELSL